ncbi:MAG TPA: ATP-dependent DNA helicase RecG [Candidatus Limnocylindrales bacterium]|nr:ATP-dependent DNA helicase RecG [Candidatus Limnocylindrales bacterium]
MDRDRRPPSSGSPARRRSRAAAPPPTDPLQLLDTPIGQSGLPGASVLARRGRHLGLVRVRDLLFRVPRRYEDLREMRRIGDLGSVTDGELVSARVRVAELRVEPSFRRRVQRTTARLEDETGSLDATWFGRRYIERRLKAGDAIVVSGKIRRFGYRMTLDNPEFQADDGAALLHAGRIVPIYRLTAGLTAASLRRAVRGALDRTGAAYPEYLPDAVRKDHGLEAIGQALEEAHYPTTFERRDDALRRLAFDELLALQLGMVARRRERVGEQGRSVVVTDTQDQAIRAALEAALTLKVARPVRLTADQAAAIVAVREDLARPTPMLRLLQGDVGSGKTAVAAWALAATALSGRQGALLAPTDLLARQHQRTLIDLLVPLGLGVELLTGSLPAGAARTTRQLLSSGQARIVVGTHALISASVQFADLGLAVVDEQHRFGVEQRAALEAKGGTVPDVLLMTATPIPRTLGQVLYADLDVTDLRTAPEGRVAIRTGIRGFAELDRTWERVREEAARGNRTFVVVPLIAPSESDLDTDGGATLDLFGLPDEAVIESTAVAAEAEAVRLRELLAPLRVGLVHGRLKPSERDAEMARFRDGALDVLVGTTVVEVGVDVPEATMMIIESADRFGLAQLHQLRGRVGRGLLDSFCVLVSDTEDATARARLAVIRDERDGFALAEKDWELRREGNVLGFEQSGLPALRVASLQREGHRDLAVRAREIAEALLDGAGNLRPGHEALAAELKTGWLAPVARAEAESGA